MSGRPRSDAERVRTGERIRREVLGDPHVDAAQAKTTPFTEPFQDLITRYAWGDIWERPGLSRAERSIVVLTVLAALQHEGELGMHVRAALGNGLTPAQIQEILLQVSIYAGVPTGNRAFAVAQRELEKLGVSLPGEDGSMTDSAMTDGTTTDTGGAGPGATEPGSAGNDGRGGG